MTEFDPFALGGRQDDADLLEAAAEIRRLVDEGCGCVAKLRYLTDEEVGMEAGDREDDVPSLRQVLAFIEAEMAKAGAA
jgi:hypothetical protein